MTVIEHPPTPPADPLEAALPFPADRRFSYRHRWDDLGQPVRVCHIRTGLGADFRRPVADVTAGQVVAAVSAAAVDVLASHAADRSQRAVAIVAIRDLQAIGAHCHCGGLLHYGAGGRWRHVNVCPDCLTDPSLCWAAIDRRRHKGCATPAPAQCEHGQCRRASQYDATRGCGADRYCCGEHDCDTALPGRERADRRDPLDGLFIPVQVPPPVEFVVSR